MDESAAPITEHLAELRNRIAWILGCWLLASVLCFSYAEEVFGFLLQPAIRALGETDATLQSIAPAEIFFTYLKCALLAGFVLTLPVFFWQSWAFVAPGLYAQEKKAVVPFVFFSTLLFAGGAIFGYQMVFPLVFEFFNGFTNEFVVSAWTMSAAFSLTTRLFLAFGVAFELPLFVFFLSITRVVSARQLFRGTPYAVLAVFVTAAILTPPDVISQVLLGLPMVALYLIGCCVAWAFDPTRKERRAAAKKAADEADGAAAS